MHEVIIAGFGGQGVLVMGQLLAAAAMLEQKHVTWFPSYGPEQRGGTCNCSVIISDREIGSPIVTEPDAAVIMNFPSLEKFEHRIRPGGLLVYNSSLIDAKPKREDLQIVAVPATAEAERIGSVRTANIIALGALMEATGIVKEASIAASFQMVLPSRHHHLIALNMQALTCGRQYHQ